MNGDTSDTGNANNPFVFFDIKFGGAKAGRVVMELFKNEAPKAVENFRALCTGEKGLGKSGKPLHYKSTRFHRVVPMFMVQGGDITNGDGTGGESIYGEKFEDENFNIMHDRVGLLGMPNNGPNTNNSQFYITTVLCSHLDGINVVFGIVRKGLNIILEMSEIARENDIPLEPIVIDNCGEFKPGDQWNIGENDGTDDVYPPWPNDWDIELSNAGQMAEEAINKIKDSGNYFYQKNNFIDSERKYKKALRYIDWLIGIDKSYNTNKIDTLRLNSLLNLAAVRLKRQKYKGALELCNQVITKYPNNGKAFYRRAQARLALTDYDNALVDLNVAGNLHPKDKNIQTILHIAKKHKLSYLKKERHLFAKLFK